MAAVLQLECDTTRCRSRHFALAQAKTLDELCANARTLGWRIVLATVAPGGPVCVSESWCPSCARGRLRDDEGATP